MTSDRPYRKGFAQEIAVKIFEDEIASGQWNPEIVRTFLTLLKRNLL
jgi:HD-GYP domain-containing protein (c-di-GMP phosphodiesterase class II)